MVDESKELLSRQYLSGPAWRFQPMTEQTWSEHFNISSCLPTWSLVFHLVKLFVTHFHQYPKYLRLATGCPLPSLIQYGFKN